MTVKELEKQKIKDSPIQKDESTNTSLSTLTSGLIVSGLLTGLAVLFFGNDEDTEDELDFVYAEQEKEKAQDPYTVTSIRMFVDDIFNQICNEGCPDPYKALREWDISNWFPNAREMYFHTIDLKEGYEIIEKLEKKISSLHADKTLLFVISQRVSDLMDSKAILKERMTKLCDELRIRNSLITKGMPFVYSNTSYIP